MDMESLINCMGSLLIMMAVGFICYRVGWLDKEKNKVLSKIVINVAQAALLVNAILGSTLRLPVSTMAGVIAASLGMYVVLWAIGAVTGRCLGQKGDGNLYHFMVMFGNVGFVGYPVIIALFGQDVLFYGALFNVVFPLILYTYGVILLVGKAGRDRISWRLLLNPSIVATLIALVIYILEVPVPQAVLSAADYLGSLSISGSMLVLGATLATVPVRQVLADWRIYVLSIINLILRPILVWAVLGRFISDPVVLGVAVIMAAVPVGANGTAMCLEYGADEQVTTRGFFMTTVLSMVTIPLVMMLLFL